MILTHTQAQTFYDHFGTKQDVQGFYEDAAIDDLIVHAEFEKAKNIFELGSGTGRLASRLLTMKLPPTAKYTGFELSSIMLNIAKKRISPFSDRAKVIQSFGAMRFPLVDNSVDRFVSAYVFDLLSKREILLALDEAHRILVPGGKLCLASLTNGVTLTSKTVSRLAAWIGGCRPVQLNAMLDKNHWTVDYKNVVTQFGVPSEVIIATAKA